MASRLAHLIMMRRSSALRLLGTNASSQFSRQPLSNNNNQRIINSIARSSSTAISNATDDPSLRRRRRRGGKTPTTTNEGQRFLPGDPSTTTTTSSASGGGAFAPKDSSGNLLTSQEYLSLASLSPWVPCPDMVIKRVFEIGNATSMDVHADLGCGDGRLNFAAVGGPYHVSKSWGVDVDENILDKCRDRLGRRFVPTQTNATAAGLSGDDDHDAENHALSEADRLEFLQADLIHVMERQKEKYQQQQILLQDGSSSSQDDNQSRGSSSSDDVITQKLSQSTIITMYFVHDALQQLQPYLASILGGKDNVRVITVGYEMKGWDATWVERVLGLTIFKYDMKDVSNDPLQWRKDVGEEKESISPETTIDFDGDYADVDDESTGELARYLRQKREQDMEELNNGLKIHHDEKLNDFAQSRSKRQAQQSYGETAVRDELDSVEDGWDFDENEDPKQLMKEAEQIMAEARRGGRGKGLMVGLDDAEKQQKGEGGKKKKGVNEARIAAKEKPVWKKP